MSSTVPAPGKKRLGFVTEHATYRSGNVICVDVAAGRVVDALAGYYERIFLCAPLSEDSVADPQPPGLEAENVELIPQPHFLTSFHALRHIVGIVTAYARTCRRCDDLFIRGMCPYVVFLYFFAWLYRCRVCHWIIGDPIALLRTHQRSGRLMDRLSLLYAYQDRFFSRIGRRLTGGAFACNGKELAEAYRSPRTHAVVSSSIRECEFSYRQDTCQSLPVRILFLGYIRPEKGVQYLFEAAAKLKTQRQWELDLVGSWERFPDYRLTLDEVARTHGIADRLRWVGYVPYGESLMRRVREADLLAFPSLSEGTPHAIIEAFSNSLPVVATSVGGIPSMIIHGENGLLVPPKDPDALALAIDRIIEDGDLRRRLIRGGIESAKQATVDCFARRVVDSLA